MTDSEHAYTITMKFGGTSVGSVEAISRVAEIARQTQENTLHHTPGAGRRQVVVIASAMSGVTNALIGAAEDAVQGRDREVAEAMQSLRQRHLETMAELEIEDSERLALEAEIERMLNHAHSLCRATSVLGECTPRGMDVISGLGERLSVRIVAACMRAMGVPAQAVDATELIVTDGYFGSASPLMDQTERRVRSQLLPMLRAGVVPVVTGFIGATEDGTPTTLGRGGSDYTATILGACLHSDEIWIWSDVDGVMTADPRTVPDAQTIGVLSYAEAAEFSYFGAKVIHPKTVLPAVKDGIPLRILNSFNPTHPGTSIVDQPADNGRVVKGITAIKQISQVTIEGRGMIGIPGVAARVFAAVAREHVSVLMFSQSSSEQSICLVVPRNVAARTQEALRAAFEVDLTRRNVERVWSQEDVAILAVVGERMKDTVGIASRLFTALADQGINIMAIAQGSSEHNISVVVSEGQVEQALRAVHDRFELGHAPHAAG